MRNIKMTKVEIVTQIREIVNDYQDKLPRDVEDSLKDLASEIEGDVYGNVNRNKKI